MRAPEYVPIPPADLEEQIIRNTLAKLAEVRAGKLDYLQIYTVEGLESISTKKDAYKARRMLRKYWSRKYPELFSEENHR
jgi:hypothetical protein